MPAKPGRPPLHPDAARIRRLALVATDDEWEAILAALPADARERTLHLLAVTGVTTQEDSDER